MHCVIQQIRFFKTFIAFKKYVIQAAMKGLRTLKVKNYKKQMEQNLRIHGIKLSTLL